MVVVVIAVVPSNSSIIVVVHTLRAPNKPTGGIGKKK